MEREIEREKSVHIDKYIIAGHCLFILGRRRRGRGRKMYHFAVVLVTFSTSHPAVAVYLAGRHPQLLRRQFRCAAVPSRTNKIKKREREREKNRKSSFGFPDACGGWRNRRETTISSPAVLISFFISFPSWRLDERETREETSSWSGLCCSICENKIWKDATVNWVNRVPFLISYNDNISRFFLLLSSSI